MSSLSDIEVLKDSKKTTVYRLQCGIVAKRCEAGTAGWERVVYEDILPHLPMRSLQYYGHLTARGGDGWLFLEDAGGETCSDQKLAARWLALLHTSASRIPAAATLPRRDPEFYHAELQTACARLGPNGVLADICERIRESWSAVERACADLPPTLVHCDFHPKNIHVRGGLVFPLDWEYAGWGHPAVDLPEIDAGEYFEIVRQYWPGLSLERVQQLAAVGALWQWILAVSWCSTYLDSGCVEKCLRKMSWYRREWPAILEGLREAQVL